MKLLLSTLVSFLAFAAAAKAADVMTEDVAAPPRYDWSGFYVGLQGGGAWGAATVNDSVDEVEVDLEGGFLGVHGGALWQMNQFVVGLEGEVNYSWADGELDAGGPPGGNFIGSEVAWFGSLNAKAGAALDRVLIYGTGGVAVGGVETSQRVPFLGVAFSERATSVGWTIGAGVDWAMTDKLIVGGQYRYYDFGSENFAPGGAFLARSQDVTLHTVGLRASYKF